MLSKYVKLINDANTKIYNIAKKTPVTKSILLTNKYSYILQTRRLARYPLF